MPLPTGLGGEKGLEDVRQYFGGDSSAGILHPDTAVAAGRDAEILDTHRLREFDRRRLDNQPPAPRHGILGIGHQIDEHLLQLPLIPLNKAAVIC